MATPPVTIDGVSYPMVDGELGAQKIAYINDILRALTSRVETGIAGTSWVPTWTNLTLGNGTVTAKYIRVGKLIVCRLTFVFGSTSAVSGDIQFTFPLTAVSYAGTVGLMPLGLATIFDTGTAVFQGATHYFSTTKACVRIFGVAGTYANQVNASSTIPMTWATGDELHTEFYYEAA